VAVGNINELLVNCIHCL